MPIYWNIAGLTLLLFCSHPVNLLTAIPIKCTFLSYKLVNGQKMFTCILTFQDSDCSFFYATTNKFFSQCFIHSVKSSEVRTLAVRYLEKN